MLLRIICLTPRSQPNKEPKPTEQKIYQDIADEFGLLERPKKQVYDSRERSGNDNLGKDNRNDALERIISMKNTTRSDTIFRHANHLVTLVPAGVV